MLSVILTAPLRIDFCGGYTDIAEISQVTGTAIANIAIDLYTDPNRTQPVAFALSIHTENTAMGDRSMDDRPEAEINLLTALNSYAASQLGMTIDYTQLLRIDVQVPVSMGLGVSSALSVLLTSAARLHQGWDLATIRNHAFRDAQIFEKEILHVKGGYQDFIPAIHGGYNWITARAEDEEGHAVKDPATVTIATHAVSPQIAAYFNTCVLIVYSLRPASSSKIIDDIVNRSGDHSSEEARLLEVSRQIHHYNTIFHQQLCQALSHAEPATIANGSLPFTTTDLETLVHSIDRAWELRQQYSELANNPVLDQVAETVAEDIYCTHGVGAGGSVLVLYGKPDRLDSLQHRLATLSQQLRITIFYPKINQSGLRVTGFR